MSKGGVAAVTCYSIISNVAYLFLAVYTGTSSTLQPLCSINAGAGNIHRVKQFFRLGVITVLCASLCFVLIGEFFPIAVVSIFTEPTPDLVEVAVYAIRIYFIAYLPMGLNIISATFHQSLEASREATLISLGRGLFFLVPGSVPAQLPLWCRRYLGNRSCFGIFDFAAQCTASETSVCLTAF